MYGGYGGDLLPHLARHVLPGTQGEGQRLGEPALNGCVAVRVAWDRYRQVGRNHVQFDLEEKIYYL